MKGYARAAATHTKGQECGKQITVTRALRYKRPATEESACFFWMDRRSLERESSVVVKVKESPNRRKLNNIKFISLMYYCVVIVTLYQNILVYVL